jgi:iron complex transport system substrate-binding protein
MRKLLTCLLLICALPGQAEEPKHIITIGGALTEIVFALEAQDLLVGNDTTSYYPLEAEKLPKVGYQRALSAEGILSLNPDLVILTDEAGPPTVLQQLKSANVKLLQLKAGRSLDDVKRNIEAIAKALHRETKAEALIQKINTANKELVDLTSNISSPKKAMFILQHGGGAPMVAGGNTAADSIITLSGARNVVTDFDGYKPLTPEAAVVLKPDIILITKQGLEQAGGKEALLKMPGISLTPAGKKGHIIAMDSLLMLGFGPRTVEAASELNTAYQKL